MIKVGYNLTDDEINEKYSQIKGAFSMPPYFYSSIAKYIGNINGKKLLDVGCGNGYLLEKLTEFNTNLDAYGLEQSDQLKLNAENRLQNKAKIIQGNILKETPFNNQEFDIVVLTEVIEHVKEPDLCLQNLRKLLKPDGILYITFPNMTAFYPFYPIGEMFPENKIARWFLPFEHPAKTCQPIDTVYNYQEIHTLIKNNNFTILHKRGYESFPYICCLLCHKTTSHLITDNFISAIKLLPLCYRLIFKCSIQ